jgi:hypothetical protein
MVVVMVVAAVVVSGSSNDAENVAFGGGDKHKRQCASHPSF